MTSELREHDGGILVTGARIPLLTIPPRQPSYEVATYCPPPVSPACPFCNPQQLDEFTEGKPIHVFGVAHHAHQLGRAIWTEVYRGDELVNTIWEDYSYNFDVQR